MHSRANSSWVKAGLLCGTVITSLAVHPAFADTRPAGGHVVAGDAAINSRRNGLLINQSSDRAVINWNSFSIGNGMSVDFNNGNGATLNRVTGNTITQLDGSLTATGSVFVLNSNGVVVGQDGVVDVGGSFVASTLNVSTDGFMRGGDQVFSGPSTASVVNFGRLGALGGDVALIGAYVENHGAIVAPDGTAALVAGYDVLMRDAALADGQFVVRLGGEDTGVLNAGRIEAASVELRANQGNVLALAGNTDGLIRAEGVQSQNGRIFLTAPGGSIRVEAPLEARNANGSGGEVVLNATEISLAGLVDVTGLNRQGGDITVEGETITLSSAANLDASGTTGGLIRIGGDLQGGAEDGFGADMDNATDVTVDRGASINADGATGTGGNIVLWADRNMTFRGEISATGDGNGTGGFAEVSGSFLLYDGTADLRSASGVFGDLLLDPFNLTISTAASSGNSGFTANANNSNINVTALTNALATANVTVSTGVFGSPGNQAGNLSVNAAISWDSGSNLTLVAARNININNDITATNGGLIINASDSIFADGAIDVDLFDLQFGDWDQFFEGEGGLDLLPAFSADDFRISGGSFLRADGFCGEGCDYYFHDIYGVQGIGSSDNFAFQFLSLGSYIDATGTENWNGGAGFVPIGTEADPWTGSLYGHGHAIVGLTINRPSEVGVGLFGFTQNAYFDNIGLVDANITGQGSVGALVGVADAFFGGSFADPTYIYDSFATGTVTAINDRAGGLVGAAEDLSLSRSWARVDVTARNIAGGLVGEFVTTGLASGYDGIEDTYAVGSVTATGNARIAGGLVGQLISDNPYFYADIETSYASGRVTGAQVGGLVGQSEDAIFVNSRWDIETTGTDEIVGAGAWSSQNDTYGLTTEEARDPDNYSGFGFGFESEWYGQGSLRPMLRSTFSDEIYVAEQLQLLDAFTEADATLMLDIDMADLLDDPAGIWGSQGFDPIGQIEGNEYTGFFDGDGHTINGLRINRPDSSYVGLFSNIQTAVESATAGVVNLNLTNVDIRGLNYVGALAGGTYDATFDGLRVDGRVRGGDFIVGGIFGEAGLSTISSVLARVAVSGNTEVGGLVGSAYSTDIAQAYSYGNVTGNQDVGGLAGSLYFSDVDQSFSVGRVTGNPSFGPAGGLIGYSLGATTTASFWDIERSGQSEGVGVVDEDVGSAVIFAMLPGLTGLTTAQFQNTTSFMSLASGMGWDFAETWAPSAPGFYPALYLLEPVIGIDAAAAMRLYGQSNASVNFDGTTFGGPSSYLFGPQGDRVNVNATTLLAGVPQNAPVGEYAFGTSGLTSRDGVQYRVVNIGGGLTINPATLTVSASDFSKIYGNADPDFLFNISGFVLGEGMSLVTGAPGRQAGEDVVQGGYRLNLGTLSAGGNYTLVFSNPGQLMITPRSITVSADDLTQLFGQPGVPLTWTIVDGMLVFNDELTGELTREPGQAPGIYAILQGSLTGGPNYNITFEPGTLVILSSALPSSNERGASTLPQLGFDDLLGEINDQAPLLPDDDGQGGSLPFTTDTTDTIVQELEDATAYCSVIGQSEYVVDCLSERLAVIAASLPQTGDYAAARTAIDQAAQQLSALVAENEDTDFPASLTRSLRPDSPQPSRPLRPVRQATLEETLQQAAAIVNQTETVLLRSSAASSDSVHFQRIATAVGSSTILLRSI